jgi:predicted CXXCH cytochrome family protein
VKLTDDFMPHARFNHTAHRVLGDKKGVDACLACHAAARSHEPTEVLLPKIETCLDCHADYSVASRAPMQCANCHEYHPPHAALNATTKP